MKYLYFFIAHSFEYIGQFTSGVFNFADFVFVFFNLIN